MINPLNNIDYLTCSSGNRIVFQPVTPDAYEAFEALRLPVDARGAYCAPTEEAAHTLFDHLMARGLQDHRMG
jgi:hypothetical protein